MNQRLSTSLLLGAIFAVSVLVAIALAGGSDEVALAQSVIPTDTATPTFTPVPPTPTFTPVPPTPTFTPVPPTPTFTPVPLLTVGEITTDPAEPLLEPEEPIIVVIVYTDPSGLSPSFTALLDWGDDTTSECTTATSDPDSCEFKDENNLSLVEATHAYADPGVYAIGAKVTADDGRSDESVFQFVVVYDPDGGFVTGGGWIDSPAGAYAPDPSLSGVASFGFVSKYKKGANTPTGNTEFQFKAGDLNFHSDSYEWLVVAGQDKAKYKGEGTINGGGLYGFMLTATDNGNSGDTFRIKIWDKNNGDAVVYDNQSSEGDDSYAGTLIGGGSIVIHTGKGK